MAYRDSTTNSATSTTPVALVPSGIVPGDIIIVTVGYDNPAASFDAGDLPPGFTELAEVHLDVSGNPTREGHTAWIGWKRATGSDVGNYTFGVVSASVERWQAQAFAFSGRHATNPPVVSADNVSANAGNDPTATALAVTALAGDDILFAEVSDKNDSAATQSAAQPTGYTEVEDSTAGFCHAAGSYRANVGAGTTGNVTSVLTTQGTFLTSWAAWLVRIPAASAGNTVTGNQVTVSTGTPSVTTIQSPSTTVSMPGMALTAGNVTVAVATAANGYAIETGNLYQVYALINANQSATINTTSAFVTPQPAGYADWVEATTIGVIGNRLTVGVGQVVVTTGGSISVLQGTSNLGMRVFIGDATVSTTTQVTVSVSINVLGTSTTMASGTAGVNLAPNVSVTGADTLTILTGQPSVQVGGTIAIIVNATTTDLGLTASVGNVTVGAVQAASTTVTGNLLTAVVGSVFVSLPGQAGAITGPPEGKAAMAGMGRWMGRG